MTSDTHGPDGSDPEPASPISHDRLAAFCACGKHVSECCCGEDHSVPHHPSGRAYYEEEWEQFLK